MRVHEQRLFKIPIDELRAVLKRSHNVDLTGIDAFLEGDFVVFSLDAGSRDGGRGPLKAETLVSRNSPRVRRRRKKRNRIRTRGWVVVERITNSQGLTANIYEPFVKALSAKPLPKAEQRKVVRQIMVDNRNRPSDESVEYFLNNTLEFLATKK